MHFLCRFAGGDLQGHGGYPPLRRPVEGVQEADDGAEAQEDLPQAQGVLLLQAPQGGRPGKKI